ncbi:insulinase family protein [Ruegeria pomeroyi]|uniref:M16 family metallopeptidase n=1 Tax=Ruegeria pomeroyi TaxID=89184 RepID=UPI001F20838D|nr:insulinase family protein [Ruegeria pomeroyi]MCE8509724.1 insulinase family protein [Ruegeria pomeroyi]
MRNLISVAVAVLLLNTAAKAFEIETHTSPEGHEFSLVSMSNTTQTVIRFAWKGGNGFVPRGKENIEELGPVMMGNGGSVGLSPDELVAQIKAIGSGLKLYSKPDAFHGLLVAPKGSLEGAAELMNTVLTKPAFDPRWLRRFQRNYVENVTRSVKTPSGQAWRTMREITVGDHPLRQVWNATPVQNISSITIEDIKDWHRRTVTADGAGIFVAGNADAQEIAKAIDIALRDLPKVSGRQDFPQLTMRYPAKTILVHRPDIAKSYILVGGPVPKTYSPNQEAREIGVGVLGVSDQSRLFTAIRKELRAAYGFKAWMDDFSRDNAMLYFQGEVETDKLQQAYDTLRDTYEDFRTGGIGVIEFPFAQRLYNNRALAMSEKPGSIANWMVEAWLTDRPLKDGLAYPKRARDLSRSPVNAVIAQDFPPFSEMVKIIVSPERDAVVADCVISDFSDAAQCR